LHAEGNSRKTYELERQGESVRFAVINHMDTPCSKFIIAVLGGWPHTLSSFKSPPEAGASLEESRQGS
jgi:hypothetical protein